MTTERASKLMPNKEYHQIWRDTHKDSEKASKARWRENNRDRIHQHALTYRKAHPYSTRARDLRNKYNLTPKQYDDMLELQNNQCAICGKSPMENKKRLSVDHCHKTKRVRGLLCYRCNTGLASFKDDGSLLYTAHKYIARAEGR